MKYLTNRMNESTYDTHLYKLSEEISNTEIDLNS